MLLAASKKAPISGAFLVVDDYLELKSGSNISRKLVVP